MTDPVAVHHARETDYVDDLSANAAVNKISWGAVFAGVALALAVQFLLNLLGVGIGAAVIDPAAADNPDPSTFSIAGGLWFLVSGIVAAFVGGYMSPAGSPAGRARRQEVTMADQLGRHDIGRTLSANDIRGYPGRWRPQRLEYHHRGCRYDCRHSDCRGCGSCNVRRFFG